MAVASLTPRLDLRAIDSECVGRGRAGLAGSRGRQSAPLFTF